MNSTSGTARRRYSSQSRPRSLDFRDDAKRNRKRPASILPCYNDRSFAMNRCNEAVELEPKRFTFGRAQWDVVNEVENVYRPFGWLGRIELFLEPEEIPGARCEIERHVAALLKYPDLANAISRDSARCDVRDRAG